MVKHHLKQFHLVFCLIYAKVLQIVQFHHVTLLFSQEHLLLTPLDFILQVSTNSSSVKINVNLVYCHEVEASLRTLHSRVTTSMVGIADEELLVDQQATSFGLGFA